MPEMQDELWAEYAGTAGFVERQTSRDRAIDEIQTGALSVRQQTILRFLDVFGVMGATWHELSDAFANTDKPMHHGQISGALSNLHKAGMVFMLRESRNKCHPYVHHKYRDRHSPDQRHDVPARTRVSKHKELVDALVTECRILATHGFTEERYERMIGATIMLNRHERSAESQGLLRRQP